MIPILYAKNASEFGNNGIGHLKDAISCKVTEERNGAYTLTLQYPIGGAWYESITEGSIIKAKANETSELQLFRVYKSSKPMKGVVTFYAEHISYDLKGLPLALLSMTDTTAEAALNAGFAACLLPHRFTGRSDITTLNKINITKPRSLRNFCGGEAGSVLSVWGGEFEFDNFTVWLHRRRGANNGVVIRYGKNLTDAKQERNISACYTHFCPYAIKKTETRNEAGEVIESTEETITLPEGVIELINPENIGHSRALPLDISDKFADGEELNVENLRTHAEEYIESHKLGVPDVNITLSFMQIWHSPEYAESAGFERVALCDTVTVFFEDLGINAEAKVIKTEYDTLEERFSKLEVGDAKSNLTDTVSGIKESIEDTKKSLTESEKAASLALQSAIENATNRITGNSGGYVVLYPANNPQEILVMDSDDKETATRVWRWNSSGLGYSKNGYNGTYGIAMTMDGAIVADFITAGTLNAINITGCTITGGSLNINDRFTVDTEGNVRTEGEIIATSGIIGGCEIKDGVLKIKNANISEKLTAETVDVVGVIKAGGIAVIGDVEIETKRATEAEGTLSSRITATAEEISSEVTRAKGAENSLSSRITQNANAITAKVSSSGGSSSSFGWSLTSSGFYLYSGSKTVMKATSSGLEVVGKITANSGSFTGSIVATNDANSNNKTLINENGIYFGNPFNTNSPSYIGSSDYSINNEGGEWAMMNIAIYSAPTITVTEDAWQSGLWYLKGWTITPDRISLRASYNGNDGTTITKNGTITASDRNVKNNIFVFSEKYDILFDNLIPRIYGYNSDTEDQAHSGFIAQEVDDAIGVAGLKRKDFAALCVECEGTSKEKWGLMYDEFISLNTWQIQKLKRRVEKLEKQLSI